MSTTSRIGHQSLYNDIEEGTERPDDYRLGGFPVIRIGDTLHSGRFKIIHKLGHGATSTIWLASSKDFEGFVAIKALTADASVYSEEAKFLSQFVCKSGIRQLLGQFTELGPNGQHNYLVLEPALCSVFASKEASYFRPLPLIVARKIISELVTTVQYLHAQGVVHGDIHTGNILLRLPEDRRKLDVSTLYDQIGKPVTEIITRRDANPLPPNVPFELVWPAKLEVESSEISLSQHLPAMLSDFGEAFQPSVVKRSHARTRPTLLPPESLFAEEGSATISFPSEMWTLGCTIVEIMGGGAPFDTWADRDAIIAEQVMALGKLPEPWWSRWRARGQFFNSDATFYLPENRSLDDDLQKRYEHCVAEPRTRYKVDMPGPEERRAFVEMLGSILILDPTKRANIDQVAKSCWMQRWAVAESRQCQDHRL